MNSDLVQLVSIILAVIGTGIAAYAAMQARGSTLAAQSSVSSSERMIKVCLVTTYEVMLRESDAACQRGLLAFLERCSLGRGESSEGNPSGDVLLLAKDTASSSITVLSQMLAFCEAVVLHFGTNPVPQPSAKTPSGDVDAALNDLYDRFECVRVGWLKTAAAYLLVTPALREYAHRPALEDTVHPSIIAAIREIERNMADSQMQSERLGKLSALLTDQRWSYSQENR